MKPIAEWRTMDLGTFRDEVRAANRPAVFRGLARGWPAVHAGSSSSADFTNYLGRFDHLGSVVDTLMGPPDINGYFFYRENMAGLNFSRSKQRLAAVLRELTRLQGEPQPPAIAVQSVEINSALPGFAEENRLDLLGSEVSPRLWIGNKVTVAPHFDLKENIAVVVAGRRRFTLFPPNQLPNLYVGPFDFSPAGAPVSMVDGRAPDFARYPRYREAQAHAETAELEPGDAIYIPYMWWHGVESLTPLNMLVNYWWNEARPTGSPFDVLMHALIVLRDMPAEQRTVWRGIMDHYVFGTNGEPLAHLAPEHRGALGGLDEAGTAAMRRYLAQSLGRS
jgi:hypothetical protein